MNFKCPCINQWAIGPPQWGIGLGGITVLLTDFYTVCCGCGILLCSAAFTLTEGQSKYRLVLLNTITAESPNHFNIKKLGASIKKLCGKLFDGLARSLLVMYAF